MTQPERVLPPAVEDLIRRVTAAGIDFGGSVDVITSPDSDDVGLYHLLGSELANGEPSSEWEQRRSRCYELAGFAFLFGDLTRAPKAMLVHGTIHGPFEGNERIGHAWVEFGDRLVWEPVRCLIRDRTAWEAFASPRPERHYAESVARRLILQTEHYGRWHESRYP